MTLCAARQFRQHILDLNLNNLGGIKRILGDSRRDAFFRFAAQFFCRRLNTFQYRLRR